ncbi:cache domain-containing protein [Leucothrix arctica]|uniref:histidine kinase n=1 Tax=Leucothrix arctica TaxID=1481894 RepID=A0A317CIA4_9GAMM|nr:cache domain-containing protein [Leucothrix arctica]PWQ96040.1 hypothetical protein DKT75_10705 [Leucothrix arctica]
MWKNLKFRSKVFVLTGVLLLFSILTGAGYQVMSNQIRDIGIKNASDGVLEARKEELKVLVDVMESALTAATIGVTDEKEIYKIYSQLLTNNRFFDDESGYFFVSDDGVNFIHGGNPSIQGKDLIDQKDSNGFPFALALNKAAKSGGGHVEYSWFKPGKKEGESAQKISYTKMIPNTSYYLGTGVYIDDIKQKESEIFQKITDYSNGFLKKWISILTLAFFFIILPLVMFMIKSMTEPLKKLTEIATDYSRGKWEENISDLDRKDEIGALSRAIKRLGVSTRMVIKKLEESK